MLKGDDRPQGVSEVATLRKHLRQDAQLAMDFAATDAKRRYDKEHRQIEFNIGDKVHLRLHYGYHLPGRASRKYSQRRSGSWIVKRRICRLAYELNFTNTSVHPVISVAHLTPAPSGDDPFDRRLPPPGPVEAEQEHDSGLEDGDRYETEIILDHRPHGKTIQYLIKWKGYGHEHNGWKSEWQLRHSADLIRQYWNRRGGCPTAGGEKKKRGRPRKN